MTLSKKTVGYLVQLGGVASGVAGVVLSFQHMAIIACFLGGAVAFYVGKTIRGTV
jgi:hypothetical protein